MGSRDMQISEPAGASQPVTGAAAHDIQEQAPALKGDASSKRRRATVKLKEPVDMRKRSQFLAVDKQLAQYFKKASGMTWPLFIALLSSTFCDEMRQTILTFRICSAISLVLNLVPLFAVGWMTENEKPSSVSTVQRGHDKEKVEQRDSCRIRLLSLAAYLSNFSLTITAISFMMVLKAGYMWLFFVLVLHVLAYIVFMQHGAKNGISWGISQYGDHRSDLDFFSGLSSEITQTNFTALSATVFGFLNTGQCMEVEVRLPEIILLIAVVIGLFLMVVSTVPPALGCPQDRRQLVRWMKFAVYGLLVLTCIGLFLAAFFMISGPYMHIISFITALVNLVLYLSGRFLPSTTIVTFKWLRRPWFVQHNGSGILENKSDTQQPLEASRKAGNAPAPSSEAASRAADEQSLRLAIFYSIVSGALMVSYSLDIRDQNWSMAIIYSAILAYLGMVIITRDATKKGKIIAVQISSVIAAALLTAALMMIIFVLAEPIKTGSSSPRIQQLHTQ